MQLLAGLGNPGEKYRHTRHNIGFRFVDLLADHLGLTFTDTPRFKGLACEWRQGDKRVLLLKPQTFMNDSGESVAAAAYYYRMPAADMFVVYDDLDLPPGKLRLRHGGGHGGHNGIRSIHQHIRDTGFTRIKLGIGRPEQGEVTPWVLGKAGGEEKVLETAAFACLLAEIEAVLDGQLAAAANRIHLCMQKKCAALRDKKENS